MPTIPCPVCGRIVILARRAEGEAREAPRCPRCGTRFVVEREIPDRAQNRRPRDDGQRNADP